MNSENRNEAEVWQVVLDHFDEYFLFPVKNPVRCLCDLVIYMCYKKLINNVERDLLLHRIDRQRIKRKLGGFQPFWAYGEAEPRKQFIRDVIKYLKGNE